MNKQLLLFLTLCLAAPMALAQGTRHMVTGTITDADTGEPLVGASAISGSRGNSANSSGFYSLPIDKGEAAVTFTMLGYESHTAKFSMRSDTVINIALRQDNTMINNIVVIGNDNTIVGSTFGKINVNMNQLKYMPLFAGEKDIFKYFQILPGVTGGKEGSSDLIIRGGSSDQSMILLDDIPIYNHNHALGFISIFNGEALSGAELYKGSIPATYGGRLSGIASMTTRNGNNQKHEQCLGIGTMTASVLLEGPIKKGEGSYLFSGRYFVPHMLLATYYGIGKPSNQTNYMFYDITGKLTYRLNDRNILSWSIFTGHDALSMGIHEKNRPREGDGPTQTLSFDSKMGFAWQNIASALKLSTSFQNGGYLTNMLYYSGLRNNVSNKYKNSDKDSMKSYNRSSIDDIGFSSIMSYNLGINDLKFGAQINWQLYKPRESYYASSKGNSEKMVYADMSLLTAALFADNNLKLGKWDIHTGLRLPLYYRDNMAVFNVEPRVGVSYRHNDKNNWYLSYDRNTQPLYSMNQQSGGLPIDYWLPFMGKDLQTSDQLSLGWKYYPLESLFISIEAFGKRQRNLHYVYDMDDMLAGVGGFDIAKGTAYGGELTVQYTGKKFTSMLSYSYIKSTRMIDGQKFNFIYDIPHNLNINMKYETLRRGDKTHFVSANISYHTGLPYILSDEIYPSMDGNYDFDYSIQNNPDFPNDRLLDYFRLDLNYTMEKKLDNGKRVWQISILNATNYFNPYIVFVGRDYIGSNYDEVSTLKAMSLIPIFPSFSYTRYW